MEISVIKTATLGKPLHVDLFGCSRISPLSITNGGVSLNLRPDRSSWSEEHCPTFCKQPRLSASTPPPTESSHAPIRSFHVFRWGTRPGCTCIATPHPPLRAFSRTFLAMPLPLPLHFGSCPVCEPALKYLAALLYFPLPLPLLSSSFLDNHSPYFILLVIILL